MRFLRLVPLLVLPMLLLGATCVTRVEQKGPTGPWVGEVTNNGPDAAGISVEAHIMGADGREVFGPWVSTCPRSLLPGQTGSFEFVVPDKVLTYSWVVPPLRLDSPPLVHAYAEPGAPTATGAAERSAPTATGLSVRLVQSYPEHDAVIAEVTNNSSGTIFSGAVCANLSDPSGKTLEVGTGDLFPTALNPGETRELPVRFPSLPDGSIQFFSSGGSTGEETVQLDPALLHISTTKVVQTERGRELQAVGEIHNNTSRDLAATWYQARLATSPTVVSGGLAGTTGLLDAVNNGGGSYLGTGVIAAGGKAPASFSFLIDQADSTRIEIVGIEGQPFNLGLSLIPVKDVIKERASPDSLKVTATLSNPTSEGMQVPSLCFNLRGNDDRLVGTSCLFSQWIEPNGTLTVSQEVTELAPTHSVEVIAYGHPGAKIVPPN